MQYFTDDSHLICEDNDRVLTLNLKPVILCLLLEIEYSMERFPVIKVESVITASVNDWLSFDLESSVKLHAFCYNMDYKNWEPLIDLCSEDDASYKSWELTIKVGTFTYNRWRVCNEFLCFTRCATVKRSWWIRTQPIRAST